MCPRLMLWLSEDYPHTTEYYKSAVNSAEVRTQCDNAEKARSPVLDT